MLTYDLTTKQGIEKVISDDFIGTSRRIVNPSAGLLYEFVKKKLSSSKEQGKIVEDMIRTGKEMGVDEMEIVVENKKVFTIKSPVEGAEISMTIGSDEKIHIKVKYK